MEKITKLCLILSIVLFLFACQSSKSPTAKAVVCNKPYILVGTSCCLDINDNLICDDDETNLQTEEEIISEENEETESNENPSELEEKGLVEEEAFGLEITVNSLVKKKCIGECSFSGADKGKIFLIADITVKNVNYEKSLRDYYYVSKSNMYLKDEKGYQYEIAFETYNLDKKLEDTKLKKGDFIRGEIAYEIAESLDMLKIVIEDYDKILAETWINLSQIDDVEKPEASFTIRSIDKSWYSSSGVFSGINVAINNSGNVDFRPRFDIKITDTTNFDVIFEESDAGYIGTVTAGEIYYGEIGIYVWVDEHHDFRFEITMLDEQTGIELDKQRENEIMV
ncbi:DUF4352 domain-containing protein [Candidatus Woesearchaeota archaeon]|nr:DUF4352 domain-containing protein [Candidatus Woesearchaeota archaeon]